MHDLAAFTLAAPAKPSPRLHAAAQSVATRLGALLHHIGAEPDAAAWLAELNGDPAALRLPTVPPDPIDRVIAAAHLVPIEIDLLLLAGLADEHEGIAAVLRLLHPSNRPTATTGLAAQLAEAGLLDGIAPDTDPRLALRAALDNHTAAVIRTATTSDVPYWDRDLTLAPGLWPALHGAQGPQAWPPSTTVIDLDVSLDGLTDWLEQPAVLSAQAALRQAAPVTIVLRAERPLAAAARALAITGRSATVLDGGSARDAAVCALAHGITPILVTDEIPDLTGHPATVIVCAPDDAAATPTHRPTLDVPIPPLDRAARRRLWAGLVGPDGPPCPPGLEPIDVAVLRARHRTAAALDSPLPVTTTNEEPCPGAILVHPTATWDHLVLPPASIAQLKEAAARAVNEATVLGAWGFLAGRPGAAGLKLLFCGPPGTGKTLAAEVLAHELDRDLLVVDLSRLVSKWIGETEKNLAAAFQAAERGDCILFFDEADALFGRRTEVGDARDRYANLETAYLLGRLERFDGVAVLATNLRQNIDSAFARRLDFVVPFDPPGPDERVRLWQHHLPPTAPVDEDVDVDALGGLYAVVGAHIRNASVAAAYLAADAGESIGWRHLQHALSREYEKAGLAFPGVVPDRFDGRARKDLTWPD
jgi:hypothetical protein